MFHIDDLPLEIIEYIIYFVCPYEDLKSCQLVCRRWYEVCVNVVASRRLQFMKSLSAGVVQWEMPSSSSNRTMITARYSHSAAIHGPYMYIFGGCTTSNTTFNDLWRYHLGKNEWMRLLTLGSYPSPKAYATMVTWGNKLVLFGGWTHPSLYPLHQQWVLFNEFHVYDIFSNRWTQIYFEFSPPPTAGHTATVHQNVLIVFGGLQKRAALSSSTNDLFCLNLITNKWYQPTISSTKPLPRYGHSQIKVDDRHILIISGCGGSNKLYTDIWLLTVPEDPTNTSCVWYWDQIELHGLDNMPLQIWYNPASKIGDYVVILCAWEKQKNPKSVSSGKMPQLFVPGSARMHSSNVRPNVPHEQPQVAVNPQGVRDVNVNGRRGCLRNLVSGPDVVSNESESSSSRPRPSVRPNASNDRDRMLQALSRMENRIHSQSSGKGAENSASAAKHRNQIFLVPHLLDIGKVISTKTASWLPISLDASGEPPYLGSPPSSCLLYSLVYGRAQLIMFGGISRDKSSGDCNESVTNNVNVISPPLVHPNNHER